MERLVHDPLATIAEVYKFIGLEAHRFDAEKLLVHAHESNSHYRHKYPHRQHAAIAPPQQHAIPVRIQSEIEKTYAWYYDNFYPDGKRIGASSMR